MKILDKWSMDASGNWVRIPFIRTDAGDKPAIAIETLIPRKDAK